MTAADPDLVRLFAFRVWSYKQGELVSLMIHLGDRLGLYRALVDAGPVTAPELAARTGLHERWLLEWLRSQAAAGLLESADGTTFALTAEGAEVLADEDGSVWFAAGAFSGNAAPPDVVDRLADAFRTGRGLTYDDLGPEAAHSVARTLGPWTRVALVPVILPGLDGVVGRLARGARVLDVGCGAGVALLAMAEAFPASQFDGVDPSEHAIVAAEDARRAAGLDNVSFRVADGADLLREPTYDLVTTFDCLHDMPYPGAVAAAIRGAIVDTGTWLVKEIRAGATWEENLLNPMLALMYSTSVATCMSSALSAPDGAGLGTLGLPPPAVERLARDAGFSRCEFKDFDDPANVYYEIRP
jgi:2-polyprenyl-3-methyl-5-hydroxy-6-metoxy-1,4-benzoquinol methylase